MQHQFLRDYSIEITAKDVVELSSERDRLRPETRVSITFLPGDKIYELAQVAARVRALGLTPVPHLSARRIASENELTRFLTALRRDAQVDRAFVVAGDPDVPIGPFAEALDLIRCGALAKAGIRHVGIAGYPQGHPKIPEKLLAIAMQDKLAALSAAGQDAEIVTQFAFDATAMLTWLERLRGDSIEAPVRFGLAGPTSVQALLRFAARCGVTASTQVLAKHGVSLTRLLGTATPGGLIASLIECLDPALHGRVGAHLYPFGGVAKLVDWVSAFKVETTD